LPDSRWRDQHTAHTGVYAGQGWPRVLVRVPCAVVRRDWWGRNGTGAAQAQ